MLVRFKMKDIQELVQWNSAHSQRASSEDLFEPSYYPGNQVHYGKNNWPDATKILRERLPRSLHLVKDHGVYMMAGTVEHLPSKNPKNTNPNASHVVYAEGCDPAIDEDWYDKGAMVFGGDDGVCNVPVDWVAVTLKENPAATWLCLNVTPREVSLKIEVPAPTPNEDNEGPAL